MACIPYPMVGEAGRSGLAELELMVGWIPTYLMYTYLTHWTRELSDAVWLKGQIEREREQAQVSNCG
jgi:hypothetical protein